MAMQSMPASNANPQQTSAVGIPQKPYSPNLVQGEISGRSIYRILHARWPLGIVGGRLSARWWVVGGQPSADSAYGDTGQSGRPCRLQTWSALRSPFPKGRPELQDGLSIPGASMLLSLCLREQDGGDCRANDSPGKVRRAGPPVYHRLGEIPGRRGSSWPRPTEAPEARCAGTGLLGLRRPVPHPHVRRPWRGGRSPPLLVAYCVATPPS